MALSRADLSEVESGDYVTLVAWTHSLTRGKIMRIIGNDLISVLGHHGYNLKRERYSKQSLRKARIIEDTRGNNWEYSKE